jgi:hypothetical protein
MILSEEYIQGLLDQALPQIDVSPEAAVMLEGSIAEGFGNESSDIDFLLIDGAGERPSMPSILFLDGRRVEVRTRSLGQILAQLDAVRRETRVRRLSEDLLNRCQRFLRGVPLRGAELIRDGRDRLPYEDFAELMAKWWAHRARQTIRQAIAWNALGQHEDAACTAEAGLVQAVKSWAAGRGETYLEPKWLSPQLDRAGDLRIAERYRTLATAAASGLSAPSYLAACVDFVADLGVQGCPATPERITVDRVSGVTTWQTGQRVHVMRPKQDVFALGWDSGRVWRSVVLGRSLPSVLAAAESTGVPDAGGLLAQFVRYGLTKLSWKGGGAIEPSLPLGATAGPITPSPSTHRPVITVDGAAVTGDRSVDLVPVPATRFAAAGMALVWSNVLIENATEDLTGARGREQWRVAELLVRRVLQVSLRGLFSAYGVHPLPPDSDLVRRLSLLPKEFREVRELARDLENVAITSAIEAESATAMVERFVSLVRSETGAGLFPASFLSAQQWQATLDLGHDWLRLGAFFDADLPLDEARDLLVSGGVQPHTIGSGPTERRRPSGVH